MPRLKSLTVTTEVKHAGARRKCYNSKAHQILKGDVCLLVKDGLAFKGYCTTCAQKMIQQAETNLKELRIALQNASAED